MPSESFYSTLGFTDEGTEGLRREMMPKSQNPESFLGASTSKFTTIFQRCSAVQLNGG